MIKKTLFFLVLVFLIVLSSKAVLADNIIGVSPATVDFKDVLRGGYAERFLTVTLDSEEPIGINLIPRGEISDWLEFEANKTVSINNPARFAISVNPPTDIPNGNYTGFLRVSTEALSAAGEEGHATSAARSVIDIALTVEITDIEILECRAQGFTVRSAEKGDDVVFEVDVLNRGNIRLKPTLTVDIWDQEQISIIKSTEFSGEEILPTREQTLEFDLPTDDLDLDQYWVDVGVLECFASDTLTFDVLERGALKANGVLTKLISLPWAEVDETIAILADFRNTGEKDLEAQFKGQITRSGKIVQVLESEKAGVPIEENTNFTFFFTPTRPGKYIASGRVFYDNKRTFESSTVINVNPKKFGIKQLVLVLFYVLILVAILFLFYKIRQEKKKYLARIRRMSE